MDWYPWHFLLYEQDTMHLNPYQDGCYRRLIDHYMKTRAPLPDNDAALSRIVGDSEANWVAMASAIVRPFFKSEKGRLFNKRCDTELARQDAKSRTLSESGKKGAEKRHNKTKDIPSHPKATLKPHSSIGEERRGEDKEKDTTNVVSKKKTRKDFEVDTLGGLSGWFEANAPSVDKHTLRQRLLDWCDANGKTYKDYHAALRTWAIKEQERHNGNHKQNTRQAAIGTSRASGESDGHGFGGRKSQTELYAEATQRIIDRRNAEWKAKNKGLPAIAESTNNAT